MLTGVKVAAAITGTVTAAMVVNYTMTDRLQTYSSLSEERSGTINKQYEMVQNHACAELNMTIIQIINDIVASGGKNSINFSYWSDNVQNNIRALEINECHKDVLHEYLDEKFVVADNLYYDLKTLIR